MRMANGYSVSLELKLLAICAPANDAIIASTNSERFEDLIRTVSVKSIRRRAGKGAR